MVVTELWWSSPSKHALLENFLELVVVDTTKEGSGVVPLSFLVLRLSSSWLSASPRRLSLVAGLLAELGGTTFFTKSGVRGPTPSTRPEAIVYFCLPLATFWPGGRAGSEGSTRCRLALRPLFSSSRPTNRTRRHRAHLPTHPRASGTRHNVARNTHPGLRTPNPTAFPPPACGPQIPAPYPPLPHTRRTTCPPLTCFGCSTQRRPEAVFLFLPPA